MSFFYNCFNYSIGFICYSRKSKRLSMIRYFALSLGVFLLFFRFPSIEDTNRFEPVLSPVTFACSNTVNNFPYHESFESNMGFWFDATNSYWFRDNQGTPTPGTGPYSGGDGNYYVYFESSSPNYPYRTGYLQGPCFDLANAVTANFHFQYHMYGGSMGTMSLEVNVEGTSTWTTLWSKSGNQTNQWYPVDIDLNSYVGQVIKFRFKGRTQQWETSDMSVDDITVSITTSVGGGNPGSGPCISVDSQTPYEEGFEQGFGDWFDASDNGIWREDNSGSTPSSNTGPNSAAEGADFLFTEASGNTGQEAILQSACIPLDEAASALFEFKYHMYGSNMGSLNLEIKPSSSSTWTSLWSESGPQNNEWLQASVDLAAFLGEEASLRFRANIGGGYRSDMAIDDLMLTITLAGQEGTCISLDTNSPYQESFEDDLGAWTVSEPTYWFRDANGTPSSSTGPSTAANGSYYVFTEASNNFNQTGYLFSPCFNLMNAGTALFDFQYHMYGTEMGTMEVEISTDNAQTWTSIWNSSGGLNNYWYAASLDLTTYVGQEIYLRFKGSIGSGYRSDMAVDNIQLSVTPPKPKLHFSKVQETIIEGEKATICLDLVDVWTYPGTITVEVGIVNDPNPHFKNYKKQTVTLQPGSKSVCFSLPSFLVGIHDPIVEYQLEISNLTYSDGPEVLIGDNDLMTLKIVDRDQDQQFTEGDIIFIGFDDNIEGGNDRIILTNLVDLEPGTSFAITNANYCSTSNSWHSAKNEDGDISVQKITYTGSNALPQGSIICVDIPAGGASSEILLHNFKIDGTGTNDFIVSNGGHSLFPKLDLPSDKAGGLFLLKGDWTYTAEEAFLDGQVISSLRIGDANGWTSTNCITDSDLPPDLQCYQGPIFPTSGYGYFDCSQFGNNFSRLNFLDYASDIGNWTIQAGTTGLDLPSNACSSSCTIISEDLYWMTNPGTLTVSCGSNYNMLIQQWLAQNGNGQYSSTCAGTVTVSHNYVDQNINFACTPSSLPVTFTAKDQCGNMASADGFIIVQNIGLPSFTTLPIDQSMSCTDQATVLAAFQAWVDNNGGAVAEDNCGEVEVFSKPEVFDFSGCNATVEVTFYAKGTCGMEIPASATFTVTDNIAPAIVSQPTNKTLNCNAPDFAQLRDSWLASAGETGNAQDNCSGSLITWTHTPVEQIVNCGINNIEFVATDQCGNSSYTYAILTITDNIAPEIIAPRGRIFSTTTENFEDKVNEWMSYVRASDECTGADQLVWTNDYTSNPLTQTTCDSRLVTFTVTDLCGNQSSASSLLEVIDVTIPVFDQDPQNLVIDCNLTNFQDQIDAWLGNHGNAMASDQIGTLSWTYEILDPIKDRCGSYRIAFTVSDECGNSVTKIGMVVVEDNSPPVIDPLNPPQPLTMTSLDQNVLTAWLRSGGNGQVSDECGAKLFWKNDFPYPLPENTCFQTLVTFSVTDGCNETFADPVLLTIDTGTPEPYLDLSFDNISKELSAFVNGCQSATYKWYNTATPENYTFDTPNMGDPSIFLPQESGTYRVEVLYCWDCGSVVKEITVDVCAAPTITNYGADISLWKGCEIDFNLLNNWIADDAGIRLDYCGTGVVSISHSPTIESLNLNNPANRVNTTITFSILQDGVVVTTVQRDLIFQGQSCTLDVNSGGNLVLVCGQTFENNLNNWLNAHGNASVNSACGNITWNAVDYSIDEIEACRDQVVTFSGFDENCNTFSYNLQIEMVCELSTNIYTRTVYPPNEAPNFGFPYTEVCVEADYCAGALTYAWNTGNGSNDPACVRIYEYTNDYSVTVTCTDRDGNVCDTEVASYDNQNSPCHSMSLGIEPTCTTQDYDILFLLDDSGSISATEFEGMTTSIEATVDEMSSLAQSPGQIRYAVALYNKTNGTNGISWQVGWTSSSSFSISRPSGNGSCADLNPAVGELIDELTNNRPIRSSAEFHLVLFTDAPRTTDDIPGCSTLYPNDKVDQIKRDLDAVVSVIRYPGGGDDEAETISNNEARNVLASSPGRFYARSNFGDPVPISEDIIECTDLTAIVPPGCTNPIYRWTWVRNGGNYVSNANAVTFYEGVTYYLDVYCEDQTCGLSATFPDNAALIRQQEREERMKAIRRELSFRPNLNPEVLEESNTPSHESNGLFRFHPNPAQAKINLEYTSDLAQEIRLVFYAPSGQKVLNKTRRVKQGENTWNEDISQLPDGLYILKVFAGSQVYTEKLIIQN